MDIPVISFLLRTKTHIDAEKGHSNSEAQTECDASFTSFSKEQPAGRDEEVVG